MCIIIYDAVRKEKCRWPRAPEHCICTSSATTLPRQDLLELIKRKIRYLIAGESARMFDYATNEEKAKLPKVYSIKMMY